MATHITGNKEAITSFIDSYDTFLFDCDGVIWSGDILLDGVADTIAMLKSMGKKLVFVSNNSTKSRPDYLKKFSKLGIEGITEEEIFSSSYSAAIYISQIMDLPSDKRTIFLISESGTEAELQAVGLKTIGGTDPAFRRDVDITVDLPALARGEGLDDSVGAVLLALDFHVNYLKLCHAMSYVRRGATLLATNEDPTLPLGGGLFLGAGSIGASVVNATKVKPKVMGKPHPEMMEAIEGRFKLDKGRTCMVGDRLDTDILFGNQGGLGGTLLVMTGVTTKEEAETSDIKPKYIAESLGDLLLASKS